MEKEYSLWADAFRRLAKNKIALVSLVIVIVYAAIALLVTFGLLADDWAQEVGPANVAPAADYLLGTDFLGRDVLKKVIYGTQVAMTVGFFSCAIAIPIGVTLGAIAGYFGGIVDDAIVWFYTTFASIPYLMMIIAIAYVMERGLKTMCIVLGVTSWVGLCRLVRGEVIKHRNRDYVQAVTALGGGHSKKIFTHILPNVFHLVIINASLRFQSAIKSEVILSYLGLGVQNVPSWGKMIDDAKQDLMQDRWWQLVGASFAMFLIVLALNILGDALRDALDPKLKGQES